MIFISVLFGFSLTKAFQHFFTHELDLKKGFAEVFEKDVFCTQRSCIFVCEECFRFLI